MAWVKFNLIGADNMNKKKILNRDHPLWESFCIYLQGPSACDFREDPEKGTVWKCDNTLSKAITMLEKMNNIDIPKTLDYFRANGGYCDCEILFNVDK